MEQAAVELSDTCTWVFVMKLYRIHMMYTIHRGAWLALLRCELPGDAYRRVLVRMHDAIIPAMPNPAAAGRLFVGFSGPR